MTSTFDLLKERWIPVVRTNGAPDVIGIEEVLLEAPDIREIHDSLPVLEFGVYRLLTAILLHALKPQNFHDVGDLLEPAAWPPAPLRAYLTQYADRFHLFGDRPFLQDPSLKDAERKPIALLNPAIPSGTNALHFHRHSERSFAVSPAVAARLLCAIPPFMTMGGAGLSPSINGAPPWYVVVRGKNLRETLLLNANTHWKEGVKAGGVPAWAREGPAPTGKQSSATALEALTWQPRRVLLFPDAPGDCSLAGEPRGQLVRSMAFVAGMGVDFAWEHDPSVAYRRTAEGVYPVRFQEGREVWRDTGALAFARENPQPETEGVLRPAVVSQFEQLLQATYIAPTELGLLVYGMRTDLKTKVFEWQRAELTVPAGLVWNSAASNQAMLALEQAEKVANLLRAAIKRTYPREGKGNKNAYETRVVASRAAYWEALREPYEDHLRRIGAPDALPGDPGPDWEKTVLSAGRKALNLAIGDLDTDSAALRRQTEARSFFRNTTRRVFHPEVPSKSRKRAAAVPGAQPQGELQP